MKISDLFTNHNGRFSQSKIAFWIFFFIVIIQIIIEGLHIVTWPIVSILISFLGYKATKRLQK